MAASRRRIQQSQHPLLGRFEPVASSVLPGAPVDADDEADD